MSYHYDNEFKTISVNILEGQERNQISEAQME